MSAGQTPHARPAWAPDGVALSPNASNYKPFIISDGAGGSIITWYGGAGSDIFARHILSDGASAQGWPPHTPLGGCGFAPVPERPARVPGQAGGGPAFWPAAPP